MSKIPGTAAERDKKSKNSRVCSLEIDYNLTHQVGGAAIKDGGIKEKI